MVIQGLEELEKKIFEQFDYINFPPAPWVLPLAKGKILDVAIIGGGMAGLSAAFALLGQGISHFQLFDANTEGKEGPWVTYARMPTLRSSKELTGPAYEFPLLTCRVWFEAQYGNDKWQALHKIPRQQWMEYLIWFRKVLNLPTVNTSKLLRIEPHSDHFRLLFPQGVMFARKVVLATGRGIPQLPVWVQGLPKELYAHTNELIDFKTLKGKRLGVVGAGASAFDAASTGLEEGVFSATLLMRRPGIPRVNKAASLTYPGFTEGFYFLSDHEKIEFMSSIKQEGSPPPYEAIDRIMQFPNAHFEGEVHITGTAARGDEVVVQTTKGDKVFDYLIVATGFRYDVQLQPELAEFADQILLWGDKCPSTNAKFNVAPYLGTHFQFLEKTKGAAPFLKDIYCFNHSAALSHGLIGGDIPGIGAGAHRLARGIAADFMAQNYSAYLKQLQNYNELEVKFSPFTS